MKFGHFVNFSLGVAHFQWKKPHEIRPFFFLFFSLFVLAKHFQHSFRSFSFKLFIINKSLCLPKLRTILFWNFRCSTQNFVLKCTLNCATFDTGENFQINWGPFFAIFDPSKCCHWTKFTGISLFNDVKMWIFQIFCAFYVIASQRLCNHLRKIRGFWNVEMFRKWWKFWIYRHFYRCQWTFKGIFNCFIEGFVWFYAICWAKNCVNLLVFVVFSTICRLKTDDFRAFFWIFVDVSPRKPSVTVRVTMCSVMLVHGTNSFHFDRCARLWIVKPMILKTFTGKLPA